MERKRTKDRSLIGKYGVANSAGVVGWYVGGPGFDNLREAQRMARIESGRGWLGECWPVKFEDAYPSSSPISRRAELRMLADMEGGAK